MMVYYCRQIKQNMIQGTGSNGNAGPISGGLPIDPAAETFKKQIVSIWPKSK